MTRSGRGSEGASWSDRNVTKAVVEDGMTNEHVQVSGLQPPLQAF